MMAGMPRPGSPIKTPQTSWDSTSLLALLQLPCPSSAASPPRCGCRPAASAEHRSRWAVVALLRPQHRLPLRQRDRRLGHGCGMQGSRPTWPCRREKPFSDRNARCRTAVTPAPASGTAPADRAWMDGSRRGRGRKPAAAARNGWPARPAPTFPRGQTLAVLGQPAPAWIIASFSAASVSNGL